MNTLSILRNRFQAALETLADDTRSLAETIGPAQDRKFGDYQANCAMPLGKLLGKAPRELAQQIVDALDIDDICHPAEIAGPGFINLRLRDDWVVDQLEKTRHDARLGVPKSEPPRTYVVDYSSPNVAKPMHVGHVRSTVIGDAISRTLRFLGHRVVTDNHLGDWGTQFGMIIYGFRHFAEDQAYDEDPVSELSRVYRKVRQLMDYHDAKAKRPQLTEKIAAMEAQLQQMQTEMPNADKASEKKSAKAKRRLQSQIREANASLAAVDEIVASIESDPERFREATEHHAIGSSVLRETADLHAGIDESRQLWGKFLPKCRQENERIYERLEVVFDEQLGESFYQDRLAGVVDDFVKKGLARQSDGATCVFLDGFEAPMIIRKQDGAFLYATTDLATIQYRIETWQPEAILYVVDFRQSEHFAKLFAAARQWGVTDVELVHVSFGTVLGDDGKPFKTRSGDTVGLESLLDEAVDRAYQVVCESDDAKAQAELSEEQRRSIADVIGHAAIKYADLSQNRTSDYVFSYDKMVSMQGNTATYMQYSFARVQAIFAKGDVDIDSLRDSSAQIVCSNDIERSLAILLLQFEEALEDMMLDYRPNLLTNYLYQLAKQFAQFFEACPVLKAETESLRASRLLICDIVGRTLKQGLSLLGIRVVEKM